jgi:hypothetical protein
MVQPPPTAFRRLNEELAAYRRHFWLMAGRVDY